MGYLQEFLLRLSWRTWVCPSEDQAWRWHSCLDFGDPGSFRCSGMLATMGAGAMALLESFSNLWQQALKGSPWLVSCSPAWHISHSMASLSVFFLCWSAASAGVWGERGFSVAPPSACDSAAWPGLRGFLAFLQRHSLPRSPPLYPLGCVSSGLHPAFQSLCSSCQPLNVPGDLSPCPGCVGLRHGLSVCSHFIQSVTD